MFRVREPGAVGDEIKVYYDERHCIEFDLDGKHIQVREDGGALIVQVSGGPFNRDCLEVRPLAANMIEIEAYIRGSERQGHLTSK